MGEKFKGVIKLDVRDSVPDWAPYEPKRAPEGAPNVLFVLYDDTGLAAWSPYGGRINMPTLDKLAANGPDLLAVAHDGALLADPLDAPDRPQPPPQRHAPAITEGANGFPGAARPHPGRVRHGRPGPPGQRLEHVLARQEPQRPRAGRRLRRRAASSGRCRRASTASTASSAARPTSGTRTWSRTTSFIDQPYTPGGGLPPLQGPRRPGASACSATRRPATRRSRGSCGSAPAPTTRRTTRRRTTSTSTRASSTTATRPTASGCWRA